MIQRFPLLRVGKSTVVVVVNKMKKIYLFGLHERERVRARFAAGGGDKSGGGGGNKANGAGGGSAEAVMAASFRAHGSLVFPPSIT